MGINLRKLGEYESSAEKLRQAKLERLEKEKQAVLRRADHAAQRRLALEQDVALFNAKVVALLDGAKGPEKFGFGNERVEALLEENEAIKKAGPEFKRRMQLAHEHIKRKQLVQALKEVWGELDRNKISAREAHQRRLALHDPAHWNSRCGPEARAAYNKYKATPPAPTNETDPVSSALIEQEDLAVQRSLLLHFEQMKKASQKVP